MPSGHLLSGCSVCQVGARCAQGFQLVLLALSEQEACTCVWHQAWCQPPHPCSAFSHTDFVAASTATATAFASPVPSRHACMCKWQVVSPVVHQVFAVLRLVQA